MLIQFNFHRKKKINSNNMKTRFYLLLILPAIFVSCSKEKPTQVAKLELLTRQDWKILKAEEKTGNNPWVDAFPYWQACEKDDRWKFKSDFSLEMNESTMPCGTNSPNQIIDIVTWSFQNNETKLLIDGTLSDIEVLNETSLIISASETIGGTTYYSRLTFGH
jgi:hypothetical protein